MIISFTTDLKDISLSKKTTQNDYDYFENERYYVFLYGYPYYLKQDSYKWIDARFIYELFINHKLKFINKIDGIFSIFLYDKKNNEIHVISDLYGLYS